MLSVRMRSTLASTLVLQMTLVTRQNSLIVGCLITPYRYSGEPLRIATSCLMNLLPLVIALFGSSRKTEIAYPILTISSLSFRPSLSLLSLQNLFAPI